MVLEAGGALGGGYYLGGGGVRIQYFIFKLSLIRLFITYLVVEGYTSCISFGCCC